MNRVIYVLILLALMYGCNNKSCNKDVVTSAQQEAITTLNQDDREDSNSEMISEQIAIEETETIPSKEKQTLSLKVNIDSIYFNTLKLKGLKSDLKEVMGVPDSIIRPKYDCGPFSEDWQDIEFYQHFYGSMNFIVYNQIAEIQDIRFNNDEVIVINGKSLSKKMNIEEVASQLGIAIPNSEYRSSIIHLNPVQMLDEYYYLVFEGGKLKRFKRYEPC